MTESGWEDYLSTEQTTNANPQDVTDTLETGATANQDAAIDSGDPTGGFGNASQDLSTAAWGTQNAGEEADMAASSATTAADESAQADASREQAVTVGATGLTLI